MATTKINKTEIKRKVISLETKINILDRLRNKERVIDVAKIYSMNEAIIRTIRKNEDSIRRSVASGLQTSLSTTSFVRNVAMERMEKALMIWLEDMNQKRIPIDTNIITNKAIKIYEKIDCQLPSTSVNKVPFNASHGWFEKFKKRHSLRNLKLKGHPQYLQHENVEIVSLPKNTTSILQPLDHGIISTFKALYIKRAFRYILDQLENDRSLSVIDAWKKFTILDCVKHVGIAYAEIKKSTLNACWKAVWPDVAERANPPILLEQEYSQIIELAHSLGGEGFEDLSEADIIEIMADKEICEDDLIDMVNITSENESDNETVADGYAHNPFTAKVVREGLEQGRKLVNYFQQNDPHLDRALRFQRNMNECLNEYEELYNVLTKNKSQSLITNFISMSGRNEINPNRSTTETASNEIILSSDESEIIQTRKRRRPVVESDSDSSVDENTLNL
ncbi:tigger transposable element-derived protein 1 [Nephila pilipes]|uniref:Tigger transposable element-derived protein 1 n=1 Tax=Nephila pilipes TaxID=299642 RepID=A0A8X6NAG7_NEPPI|nr:tigger transposable element-derived protein 1 [Nephila pilipes]